MRRSKGRPPNEEFAISQPTLPDVLAHFENYARLMPDSGLPLVFSDVSPKKRGALRLYHGTERLPGDTIEFIGLRGKLYALSILLRHRSKNGITVNAISAAIVESAANRQLKIPRQSNEGDVRKAFRELLSNNNIRYIPDESLYGTLIDFASIYFSNLISSLQGSEKTAPKLIEPTLHEFLSDDGMRGTVETLYESLKQKFGIENAFQNNHSKPFHPPPVARIEGSPEQRRRMPQSGSAQERKLKKIAQSWLDDAFRRQLSDDTRSYPEEDRNSHLNKVARDLVTTLGSSTSKTRLVLLEGAPHSGKKVVIAEILREISDPSTGRECLLDVRESKNVTTALPVMAIVARSQDQFGLAVYLRAFLQRLDDRKTAARPYWAGGKDLPEVEDYHAELLRQSREAGEPASVERTIAEIARLSQIHPAFYLFADLDGLGRDSVLKLLRGYDATRLLNILTNNKHTRIILSAHDHSAAPEVSRLDLSETAIKVTRIPNPVLARLPRYWSNDATSPVENSKLDGLWESARPRRATHLQKPVEGECLVLCASILQLCAIGESTTSENVDRIRLALQRFVDGGDQAALTSVLADALIDHFDARQMLPAMTLIAVAEDGVLEVTLLESLKTWNRWADHSCPLLDEDALLTELSTLKTLAGGFLLREEKDVTIDEHEFGLEETDWELSGALQGDQFQPLSDQFIRSLRVWSFDSAVRVSLINRLQDRQGRHADLFRQANRVIALAARRRAQHKKVNLPTPFSMQPQIDSARDIQAYVCLLASLTEKEIVEDPESQSSLMSSTDNVFSIGQDFKAGLALRFAYFALLREDIDRDFRLSMVSDQDMLRLRLYLLLLLPVGSHYFGFVADLAKDKTLIDALPRKIPPQLTATFSPDVLAGLCAAIAISAFQAHQPELITYIQDILDDYLKEQFPAVAKEVFPVVAPLMSDVSRVWFAKLDFIIATRVGLDEAADIIEALLDHPVFEDFRLEEAEKFVGYLEEPEKTDILKAWMRLKFREAELHSLNGETNSASAIFERLVAMDDMLCSTKGLLEPIVFSGRTARRYIRHVYGDPFVRLSRPSTDQMFVNAKTMIEVNISRQRKFSGVDRVGVLIDLARRHAYEENPRKALGYITKANIRAQRNSISHFARLELLMCLASIRIWCAASDDVPEAGSRITFLEKARETAGKLRNLAGVVGSDYFSSIGTYLEAKSYFEGLKLGGVGHGKSNESVASYVEQLRRCMTMLEALGETTYRSAIKELVEDLDAFPA